MNKVLVIAAHPDDEVLGCGGTIARHAANGDQVHIIIMADGVAARGETAAEARYAAAGKAATVLGAQPPQFQSWPDNQMDSIPLLAIAQKLEAEIAKINPKMIYTHHAGDLNIDHQLTHQAVMTACRPLPMSSIREIRCFEVLSATEWASPSQQQAFIPNCAVDISEQLDIKMMALEAYAEEMRPFPHARSYEAVKSLAVLRGAQMGMTAAEAFVIARFLWC